ncbi:MAG: hypothetical protein ACR2GZ_01445 [Solirubrobacteraceae bacterium]
MSKFTAVPTPLEIDDVLSARVAAGETRLTLSGRWLSPEAPSLAEEPLLVIQVEGRRHRFTPETGSDTGSSPGVWRASFVVPAWAEPRRTGQAAVWVGDAVIALPAIHAGRGGGGGSVPPALAAAVAADSTSSPGPEEREVPPLTHTTGEAPRSGPLADLLLKETVVALHAELEQRGIEAAQLRSALSGAHSELEARAGTQSELEGTLGQLGSELRRLMEAVAGQRRELDQHHAEAERERAEVQALREQLAEAEARFQQRSAETAGLREELASVTVSREAAHSEVAGLRSELERLGAELAVTREHVQSEAGDLGEANRLLADAKALAEELRPRPETP